ncbi:hypothetical protein HDU84_009391 [Entophlyctis sp. JEL0112]|nr:hypothetical protein HDU84_009391 [Entophlyctis sp. JEL0112]
MDISSLVLRPSPPALSPAVSAVGPDSGDGGDRGPDAHQHHQHQHHAHAQHRHHGHHGQLAQHNIHGMHDGLHALHALHGHPHSQTAKQPPMPPPPAAAGLSAGNAVGVSASVSRTAQMPPPQIRLPVHRFPNLFNPQPRPWASAASLQRLQQPYSQPMLQSQVAPQPQPARDPKKLARNRDAQRAFRLRQAQRIAHHQSTIANLTRDVRARLLSLQQRIDGLADASAEVRRAIDEADRAAAAAASKGVVASAGDVDSAPAWLCSDCASDDVATLSPAGSSSSDTESELHLEKCRISLEMLPSLVGTDLARRYFEMESQLSKCSETGEFKDCLMQLVAVREELLDECSATDWKRALDILEDLKASQSQAAASDRINRAVCDISKSVNIQELKTRAPMVPGFLLKGQLTQALTRIPPLAQMPDLVENLCDRCWDYFYAADSDGSALFAMYSVFQEVYGFCTDKDERIQLARATDSARQFSKKGKSRLVALQKVV